MLVNQQDRLIIAVPQEFNFKENISYMSRSTNECMFEIRDGKVIKAIPVANEILLVEVSENIEGKLLIRFIETYAPSSESVRDKVIHYVQDWFDLNTDLKPFYRMAEQDPLLKQAVNEFYGLRNIGIPDLFEALCWGILGQQINLTYAYTLKRRFVETFGSSIEWDGQSYWLFPDPEDIAKLTVEDLSALKMTVKKCEYLIGVAQLITDGSLSKAQVFGTGDFKQAEKMLVKIRGVGPWTANYVLMRCLRFPNAFPIADVGLHNAIKHLTEAEEKPTKEEILKLAAPWKNWEAYATFYLWRFLY
ncbi:DNA-3-methyladenine glycosylase 2 family protein [Sporosarcina sp. ANT_H38]|uniref:DNA-3-methyladenine glycosylase family protein n=1 Tax=Sporosarcina sp. ANT_H38 TaxID=2597358 RepID=UPI0011F25C47|nr:DNA-3-methyladenine glycosylase [Sporosarcina sp. ANT_H38]KAA0941673.1 DNA-3-methyladenine glycosylase 2 family protein [Sporosarcina sp. ANT_H38]